jgi:hypothetical protein
LLYRTVVGSPVVQGGGDVRLFDVATAAPDQLAPALEKGSILFWRQTPFELISQDCDALLSIRTVPGAHHKNIAFKPDIQKVTGAAHLEPQTRAAVTRVLKSYSSWAVEFLAKLLPSYAPGWRIDYASFRPVEEENRDLPWKKRNDLIHIDAFPSRPTNGGLILRLFTNVNPTRERVWVTGPPFAAIAKDHAIPAGLPEFAGQTHSSLGKICGPMLRGARTIGLRTVDRSPYDRFMLAFHDYLKANSDFQKNCPKYRFSFPPGSTWMVFTDIVPHSVLSGQYALEQTFIVSPHSLSARERAPISILESISHAKLAIAAG